MSSKLKSDTDCVTGRDYLEYARAHGWPIRKNGSYWEIEENGVIVRIPDTNRCLPKETRGTIHTALVRAGLALAAAAAVLAWVIF